MLTKRILLLFFICVLFAVALYFYFSRKKLFQQEISTKLAVEDTAQITKIHIFNPGVDSVKLKRKNTYWTVNQRYVAQHQAIGFLLKIIKELELKAPVSLKNKDQVITQLEKQGKRIQIYQKGELSIQYIVGEETPQKNGTYMKPFTIDEAFIMYIPGYPTDLSKYYLSNKYAWRTKDVFKYKASEIAKIVVTYPSSLDKSFVIHNTGKNTFDIKKINNKSINQEIDYEAVNRYVSYFSSIKYEKVLSQFSKTHFDSLSHQTPKHIIKIVDKEGNTNKISTFLKYNDKNEQDLDRMYAIINDDKLIYQIKYFDFDPILKTIDYFLK